MYLAGNPIILYSLLFRNGGLALKRISLLMVYSSKSMSSLFWGLIESIFYSRRIEKTNITGSPVFIIGHYRSGTTLLHKLLICDNNFGYIKYQDVFCPVSAFLSPEITRKWLQLIIRFFNVKNIFFNNMILRLDDPGEEDLYMASGSSPYSTAWGFVFPGATVKFFKKWTTFDNDKNKKNWTRAYNYYLNRATLENNYRPLILKSPPNTARVRSLLEMFPDARFIHIYRNPYQVYYSMQNLWNNVIEKHFALQNISGQERKENIFIVYLMLMDQLERDMDLIPKGHLVEIRYEDLENNPIREVERIYDALGIQGFAYSVESIKKRLELEKKYSPLTYQFEEKILDEVYERWGYYVDKWNYQKPGSEKIIYP